MAAEKRTKEGLKAKRNYIMEYDNATYDKIYFRVPKGEKKKYKQIADTYNMSLSGLCLTAIDYYIERHK